MTKTCLAAEAMLVNKTILIWVLTPRKMPVGVVFTSDEMVHLLQAKVMRELESTNDTYLGHDNNFVTG